MTLKALLSLPVALACLLAAPFAHADGSAGGYSVAAGLGATLAPRYLGSSSYQVMPVPYLNVTTPVGIYIDSLKGVGFKWALPANLFIDTSVNYAFGRKDEDEALQGGSDYLKGMGDIPGALVTTVTAGYRLGALGAVTLSADVPLTNRSRGEDYRVGFRYVVFQMGRDRLSTMAEADFGSSKYNQTFFGVDAAQSARTPFAQYDAGSGIYAVRVGLTWEHRFDRHWSLSATQQLTSLTGDAVDSPIVQRRVSLATDALIGYTF